MSKTPKAPINIEILKWCMSDLNIDLKSVAKKTGTTEAKVLSWIDGNEAPTYKQAETLAYKVFKKPLAIFFMAEIPEALSVKKKFRSLPEYMFELISYKTRLAINKADYYKSVLKDLYRKNPSEEPIFKGVESSVSENPAKLAQKIRAVLEINYETQKSFKDRYKAFNYYRTKLEERGVFTFQLKLEGDRAFCLLDDEFPVIVLNSGDSVYSKIFSLFHELAHIIIESDDILREVELPFYSETVIEKFCNRVAAEILVPSDEFSSLYLKKISKWNVEEIQKVANDYSVSKEVILRKLLDSGIANSEVYSVFKKKWDDSFGKKKSGGGDYYRNKVSSLGKKYVSKVLYDYKLGVINDLQVSDYLGVKYSQLSRIESEVYA